MRREYRFARRKRIETRIYSFGFGSIRNGKALVASINSGTEPAFRRSSGWWRDCPGPALGVVVDERNCTWKAFVEPGKSALGPQLRQGQVKGLFVARFELPEPADF
jgi:hypothetical protein